MSNRFAETNMSTMANATSIFFYSKTKGEIEEAVKKIGFEGCFIFRPSLLLGHRTHVRFGESIAQAILPKIAFLLPNKYRPIQSKLVAIAMQFVISADYSGNCIFESDEINAIAAVICTHYQLHSNCNYFTLNWPVFFG